MTSLPHKETQTPSSMPASSNFFSAKRELESTINRAPLDEISDVLSQNLYLPPFEGVKKNLRDSLDDLMTYTKIGKEEAIRELVSIANQITNLLSNGNGFTAPPFEESEEELYEPSWRKKVDESVKILLEEETSLLEKELGPEAKELGPEALPYSEGYLVFPPLSPPPSLLNFKTEETENEEDRKLKEDRRPKLY